MNIVVANDFISMINGNGRTTGNPQQILGAVTAFGGISSCRNKVFLLFQSSDWVWTISITYCARHDDYWTNFDVINELLPLKFIHRVVMMPKDSIFRRMA
jgi:hypothetical protein